MPLRPLLALLTLLSVTAPASAHPQDGPHADVRTWITDSEVSFHIAMNLVFLDEIVPGTREDPMQIHPIEEAGIRAGVFAFFRDAGLVTVDGIRVDPIDTSFEVLDVDQTLLPLFPRNGLRGLTKFKILLTYPVKSPPSTVRYLWPVFPVDILTSTDEIEAKLEFGVELNANGRMQIVYFTEAEPEYIWHAPVGDEAERFLPVPAPGRRAMLDVPMLSATLVGLMVLSTLLGVWRPSGRAMLLVLLPALAVGAFLLRGQATLAVAHPWKESDPLPTNAQAVEAFRPFHGNIYRAFDYTDESAIYDALARSVDGPFLDELYNEIYRSLIMYEEGGAVSRVASVTPLDTEVGAIGTTPEDGRPTFHVTHRWQVEGVVYHWGHSHRRLNEYLADYAVVAGEDGWRIAGSTILEQFRVDAVPLGPVDPALEL